MVSETWGDVPNTDGNIRVSNLGRLLRIRGSSTRGRKENVGKVVTIQRVWVKGRGPVHISILVLETFVGPCPEGMECCHYDDDRTNNKLTNLRWDTHKANIGDSKRNGKLNMTGVSEYNRTRLKRSLEKFGIVI